MSDSGRRADYSGCGQSCRAVNVQRMAVKVEVL